VPLPTYPWQRRRHWLAVQAGPAPAAAPVPDRGSGGPEVPAPARLSAAETEASLLGYVRERLADALDLDGPGLVPAEGPLDALGLSSLAVVELKNRIERDFAVAVPLQALLEGSTPLALARAVAAAVAAGGPQDDTPTGSDAS
jgi:acyl carrier protein